MRESVGTDRRGTRYAARAPARARRRRCSGRASAPTHTAEGQNPGNDRRTSDRRGIAYGSSPHGRTGHEDQDLLIRSRHLRELPPAVLAGRGRGQLLAEQLDRPSDALGGRSFGENDGCARRCVLRYRIDLSGRPRETHLHGVDREPVQPDHFDPRLGDPGANLGGDLSGLDDTSPRP